MKKILYHVIWLFAAFFIVSCEDLEDTYDEYAGNGVIRYVGKCSNLEVEPGWNRLKVKWKGNMDAAIEKVKITWQAESDAQPNVQYVEPLDIIENADLLDSIYIENLSDAVYTITVSNLTADSMESIVETAYARPYTENHEDLRTFTRGIVNFYVVEDKLVVFLDEDNGNLIEMKFMFWDTDGNEHVWDIKQHMGDTWLWGFMRDYIFLLPEEKELGIDFGKPLIVKRKGKLEGCIDEITFADDTLLLDEEVWSAGFTQLLTKKFGNYTQENIDTLTTIELDYNMATFQDLFYFPNLKKVVLGKNRYMQESFLSEFKSTTDEYIGLMTLQFLKETRGVSTEQYNEHYVGELESSMLSEGKIDADLVTKIPYGQIVIPQIEPLDTTGWIVTCSDTVYNGKGMRGNGAYYLLDGDINTYFEPGFSSSAKVIEVDIDMITPRVLNGIKVVQPMPVKDEYNYILSSVKVEVSADGYTWENATYEDGGITIGNSPGEITFIDIPEAYRNRTVRYIRLTMANQQVDEAEGTPLFSLRLADFIPY